MADNSGQRQENGGSEAGVGIQHRGSPQQAMAQWLDGALRDSPVTAAGPEAVSIEDGLDIRVVSDLRARLLDAFERTERVIIDLSRVSSADAAGLQLLLSARRHATASGRCVELKGPTPPLLSAASALGLRDALGFD